VKTKDKRQKKGVKAKLGCLQGGTGEGGITAAVHHQRGDRTAERDSPCKRGFPTASEGGRDMDAAKENATQKVQKGPIERGVASRRRGNRSPVVVTQKKVKWTHCVVFSRGKSAHLRLCRVGSKERVRKF